MLEQKSRDSFLAGMANRAHVVEALADDLIKRNIW
jgi:hypothetical protein